MRGYCYTKARFLELYHDYRTALALDPDLNCADWCRREGVNYEHFRRMVAHVLNKSLTDVRREVINEVAKVTPKPNATPFNERPIPNGSLLLGGVRMTFPDRCEVSIERCTVNAVVALIKEHGARAAVK